MPIGESVLVAILAALATAGFINLTTQKGKDGLDIFSGNQKILTLPPLGVSDIHFDVQRITTQNTVRQNTPDISIKNNYNGSKIFSVAIIPNAQAKTDAVIDIRADQGQIGFIGAGAMTDLDVVTLPLPPEGFTFPANKSLDFYIFCQGVTVGVTIYVLHGVLSFDY